MLYSSIHPIDYLQLHDEAVDIPYQCKYNLGGSLHLDTLYPRNPRWSRSTALPAKRFFHSESGNCGHLIELTTLDLVNLRSRAKFWRVAWVSCRDSGMDDYPESALAQGKTEMSTLLFDGCLESSSSGWGDRARLDGPEGSSWVSSGSCNPNVASLLVLTAAAS